jgi:hypothetical protein
VESYTRPYSQNVVSHDSSRLKGPKQDILKAFRISGFFLDFQSQARQGASEWIALPEIIGLSGFEHITPSKTSPALLL